jgi:hypothetical protein
MKDSNDDYAFVPLPIEDDMLFMFHPSQVGPNVAGAPAQSGIRCQLLATILDSNQVSLRLRCSPGLQGVPGDAH